MKHIAMLKVNVVIIMVQELLRYDGTCGEDEFSFLSDNVKLELY